MISPRDSSATGIVHVLDDDPQVRNALARLLQAMGHEVHQHDTAASYLLEPPRVTPSCLLLDVRMPGLNGLEMQEALARLGHQVPIVFLTGHGDIPMSVRAMRAGAIDFLTKPVDGEQLRTAVGAALSRHARDVEGQLQQVQLKACFDALTARECEVFEGVIAGKLNKQIAAELDIAERTVKAHRAQMMAKMRVRTVADLVRLAEQLGKSKPAAPERK